MTREYAVFNEIKASKQQILRCSFSFWYDLFKEHSFEATVIPLPAEFVEYLGAESIRVPGDESRRGEAGVERNSDNEYSDWLDESQDEDLDLDLDESQDKSESKVGESIERVGESEVGESVDKVGERKVEDESGEIQGEPGQDVAVGPALARVEDGFQQVHAQIKHVIQHYKAVAPKLNWSAPKDSTWIMATHSMKCDSATEVYLMLNASDHVAHDLDFPFEDATEEPAPQWHHELVLRRWQDVNPALEFRVFVRDGEVVGKSQRDLNYYDYLRLLVEEQQLARVIDQFVGETIVPRFPNRNFIVDVYCPRPFDHVIIVDINPFIRVTDSILYTWTELLEDRDEGIRLITETNLGRFKTKAYSENQVPLEVIQASVDPGSLVELAREWTTTDP